MTDPASQDFTDDTLLDGRVRLMQPAQGYRAAIDPVMLAAAIPAKAGETVLDLGCGAGAAALCLAMRVDGCRITGIEAERGLVRLAGDNVVRNGLSDRVLILAGDLSRPPQRLEPGSFAHVMANPPYLAAGTATPSPVAGKAQANIEGEADLAAWMRFALTMTRAKGSVTVIHRADRLENLLALLTGRAGEIVVFPLWSGAGKDAKRVIVRARKGIASPTRMASGLVLHETDGRFTEAAQAVLRHGAALPIGTPQD
ncbi:MAG TPA: methyltransferase [Stellaceae bacterium]|nr:methyltransferase [Stellaceae bacterium]